MNGLCIITFQPNSVWCDFLNSFKNYKIFIVVDDIHFDCKIFRKTYQNIVFIQINSEKCRNCGYSNMNFVIGKLVSGWDKALFYFGYFPYPNFIWFIEDDVYFYNENTIQNIDCQYDSDDLLCSGYGVNMNGDKNVWHWGGIHINYPPPYYNGMMCAVRLSNNMIKCIHNYALCHRTLFFLEALFPTIAMKNNLKIQSPHELNTIFYRANFQKKNINTTNLFHPVKNINQHIEFRISN